MTKGQGDGQRPGESGPPARYGTDPLALVTLIGVVGLLMIAFANWRDVARIDRSLGERLGKLETQMNQVASRMDRPAQAAPQRGPDPNRVYSIQTASAPARGPVEELWTGQLRKPYSVHQQPCPKVDAAAARADVIEIPVQVHGKVRDRVTVPAHASEAQIKPAALASEQLKKHMEGREPKKVIVVQNRLVSVVV